MTGTWGTSPWTFDSETGALTIHGGEITNVNGAPWANGQPLFNSSKIKKIILDAKVVAPQNSDWLFAGAVISSQNLGFTALQNITSIEGLSNLDTSKVTSMQGMFCYLSVTSLDLSSFDTSNVTYMTNMLAEDSSLTSVNLSSFDTSKVTSMKQMFTDSMALTDLDLSSFDTSNVTTMQDMFSGTTVLSKITLGDKFKFASYSSFSDSYNGYWTRSDGQYGALATNFASNYGTTTLPAGTYIQGMFWGTSLCQFDSKTGTLTIGSGDLSGYKDSPWNRADEGKIDLTTIKKIVLDGKVVAPKDSTSLFSGRDGDRVTGGLSNVKSIDGLSNLDTSNVTDMTYMFLSLSGLTSLDVSSFDTSKVTNMSEMFNMMSSLTSLDVSNFNTSNVTDMGNMFNEMSSLTSLDLSSFDISNVINMEFMLWGMSSLTSLDLSSFDTSDVTSMRAMFYGVESLNKINLGQNFKFQTNASFPASSTTGNWTREDGKSKAYSATDFMANYGTGDLTAGTYIPEPIASTLQLTTEFDKENYTIGDKINTTLTIKGTEDAPEGSVAKNIKLTNLDKFTLEGAQVLPENVVVETYDSTDTLIDSKEQAISESMALPDLEKGQYIKIKIEGQAWNNTDDATETNYSMGLENNDTSSENYTGKVSVQSGNLEFKDIPENLDFNSAMLSAKNKETLIDRQEKDWTINISDMRGTNPHGDTKEVDRKNWKMYVSADEFKDASGTSVPYSTLSTSFVKNGETTELNNEETMVENHEVTNETPELNHLLGLNWGESEGFKAILHDNTKLSHDKNYSADMTFELRIEP